MSAIKGRHFKVEYEGLHLICLHYGKYGHTSEGCQSQKGKITIKDGGLKVNPPKNYSLEEQVGKQESAIGP